MAFLKGIQFSTVFSRVTNQRFIPEIDGLRFMAIIPVILLHLSTGMLRLSTAYDSQELLDTTYFRRLLLPGAVGVYIFFVISGFVLALPFARHFLIQEPKVRLKKYFLRRLTRLEPPYLITLFVLFLAHVYILKTSDFNTLFEHYLASFFYAHNFIYNEQSLINPVAWSLEIEIQFYLLVPILTQMFRIRNSTIRQGILLILIFSAFWIQRMLPLFDWHLKPSFISSYQFFLSGFLLADLYISGTLKSKKWFWDIIGIISIFLIFWLEYNKGFYRSVQAPVILLSFIAVFKGEMLNRFFTNTWISTIGGMCYITYLIHYALIHFLFKFFGQISLGWGFIPDYFVNVLIYLPAVLIISAIAFLLFEKPFMYPDWPKRVSSFVKARFVTATLKSE